MKRITSLVLLSFAATTLLFAQESNSGGEHSSGASLRFEDGELLSAEKLNANLHLSQTTVDCAAGESIMEALRTHNHITIQGICRENGGHAVALQV